MGGSQPPIGYYFISVGSPYQTATRNADSAWDATSSPGYFFEAPNSVTAVHVFDGDYGANGKLAWVTGGCGGDIYWELPLDLYWNQHYLDDDNASVKKAVGVHELGHVYGLWDKSHLDCHNQLNHGAMMNGGATMYNLCGWTTPKVDDVEGVNAIY